MSRRCQNARLRGGWAHRDGDQDGECVSREGAGHDNPSGARERVEFLQFSPDGRSLVAPCSRGVQVWHDLTPDSRPATTFGHPYISLVRFTPDGSRLLPDAPPAWVAVYGLAAWQVGQVPLELAGGGGGCDLTPDGHLVVAGRTHTGMGPPGRLSCRPIRNPEATLWSVAT